MNLNNPYGNLGSIASLFLMMQQARQNDKKKFNALSKEEQIVAIKKKEDNRKAIEALQEQKRVNVCINQGKCPNCLGKLIRGKKDKKNGYRRTWKCLKCDKDIIN